MNRFDRNAGESPSVKPDRAGLGAAEYRFRMIRHIKARVRSERALGLSPEQVLANTRAIQDQEIAKRLEDAARAGRALKEIAIRATIEALAETPAGPSSFGFARWLAETIHANSPHIRTGVRSPRPAPNG